MDPVAIPASAPITPTPIPPTPEAPPVRAVDQAASTGNFADFRKATRAERAGTPLPPVAPPETKAADASADAPKPGDKPDAPRELSKRQQDLNRKIQQGVSFATADLRRENDQLRAQLAGRQPAAPQTPPAQPVAAAALDPSDPEPKIDDFADKADPYAEHLRAVARWEARQERKRLDADASQRTVHERAAQQYGERVAAFHGRIDEAKATDPKFLTKLNPAVTDRLQPFSALAPGDLGSPVNVLCEEVMDSPASPQLLIYLSDHPEEVDRFARMTSMRELTREFALLEHTVRSAATPPVPKTVTTAPDPVTTLGTRPQEPADAEQAAIQSGNFRQFRQAQRARRAARSA